MNRLHRYIIISMEAIYMEGDDLPQINLALLYGEISRQPVYYRKLPGNITDVKLVKNLLKDINFLPLRKLSFVMY